MSNESKPDDGQTVSQAAEELTKSVTDLVTAVFGVGASLARSVAQATAGGRPVPPPSAQGPLNEAVHYGVSTLTNVLRLVVAPVQSAVRSAQAAPTAGTSAPAAAATTSRPTVAAGSTLRVPLSIENPGPQSTGPLDLQCLRVDAQSATSGQRIGVSNVRLEPQVLTIAPRDFEKLTVFVDTPPTTAPGTYLAVVGTATFQTAVEFDVTPPRAPSS